MRYDWRAFLTGNYPDFATILADCGAAIICRARGKERK